MILSKNKDSSLLYKNSKYVKELSPKDFKVIGIDKQVMPKKYPVLIKFYAHWCPHCSNPGMHQFMEAIGESFPKKAGIQVAALSCEHNEKNGDIARNIGIMGYPTFKYYNSRGEMSEYRGGPNPESLVKFLLEHS